MSEVIVRALHRDDARSARSLIEARFAGTRYRDRLHELLASALHFDDDEHLALVSTLRGERDVRALAIYGSIAGASAVTRLHALLDDGRSTDAAVLRALVSASGQARMLVLELPDDTPFERAALTLEHAGFAEEGRVDDLVADGVAMRLLVRRATAPREVAC